MNLYQVKFKEPKEETTTTQIFASDSWDRVFEAAKKVASGVDGELVLIHKIPDSFFILSEDE